MKIARTGTLGNSVSRGTRGSFTKPRGYDGARRITCSLSYSLHMYRPACSVRGASPGSPSVPQRRALENARSAGTKAFRRGVYACGWSCASLNYSSQAHPSNSAARNGFLFNVPASATSRIGDSTRADSALSHPSCQRSADTPYRQIRLSTLRCHKVPIDSDLRPQVYHYFSVVAYIKVSAGQVISTAHAYFQDSVASRRWHTENV